MALEPKDKVKIDVVIRGTYWVSRETYGEPLLTDEEIVQVERETHQDGWYSLEELVSFFDDGTKVTLSLAAE